MNIIYLFFNNKSRKLEIIYLIEMGIVKISKLPSEYKKGSHTNATAYRNY